MVLAAGMVGMVGMVAAPHPWLGRCPVPSHALVAATDSQERLSKSFQIFFTAVFSHIFPHSLQKNTESSS